VPLQLQEWMPLTLQRLMAFITLARFFTLIIAERPGEGVNIENSFYYTRDGEHPKHFTDESTERALRACSLATREAPSHSPSDAVANWRWRWDEYSPGRAVDDTFL